MRPGPGATFGRRAAYRIAANTLKEITGEQEFDFELLGLIAEGSINLNEVIKEKQNSSPDDHRDWLLKNYLETMAIRDLESKELKKELLELL